MQPTREESPHYMTIVWMVVKLIAFAFLPNAQSDDTINRLKSVQTGQCFACEPGWYGNDCSRRCSTCDREGCEKESGVCHRCPPGYFTPDCSRTCPPNFREKEDGNVYCDQHTGKCLEHCKNSLWWGDACNQKCSERCVNGSCMFSDGSCAVGCLPGWSGSMCNVSCPDTCAGGTCSVEGKCTEGCEQGLFGPLCDQECSETCTNWECNQHGRCVLGCQKGFHGDDCTKVCDISCLECKQEDGTCINYKVAWDGTGYQPNPTWETDPHDNSSSTLLKRLDLHEHLLLIVVSYLAHASIV